MSLDKKKPQTRYAHAGSKPEIYHGAVNVPVHRMSTIVFNSYDEFEKVPNVPYSYGRAGTPSTAAFEEAIAAIDGAAGAVAVCSGLAAILTAMMAFARAGDHILVPDNCYGPARKSCEEVLRRFGIDIEYYDPMIGADIARHFRPNTKLVYMEAPGSLTFEVQDVGAITAAAKKAGIKTAIDNSWATPIFFQPMALGIDMAVMSATKYVSGHSDVMLGVVSAAASSLKDVRRMAQQMAYCAGSEEVYLGLRGLRTLHVRLAQHQKNALELAQWLTAQPAVKRVIHPALPGLPGHEHWRSYFTGSTGTFSMILHETRREKIAAFLDQMEVFSMGFSWGGYESLLFPEQPHPIRTVRRWDEKGFSVRIHVGLEDLEDLKADLAAGFNRLR